MKKAAVLILVILVGVFGGCGKLDDQAPMVQIDIQYINPAGVVDAGHFVYVSFYSDNAWLIMTGSFGTAATFFGTTDVYPFYIPTVPFKSTYFVAWHDLNGNGILDTGDPAVGYDGIAPTSTLTQFTPPKLMYTKLLVVLDGTVTYP